jgi:DNA-binding winged helix-turn-helix (wHTH) protein
MRFEFGDFVLDPDRQELSRSGEVIHLTPKAMQLLELLVDHRPNVVSHQQLYDALWPDVVVLEANLKNLMADLRNALDDHERNGRFIRTVHGRGYAFTDEVVATRRGVAGSRLVVFFHGNRRIILQAGENIVGRGEDATTIIDDPEVSRHHVRIIIDPHRVTVEDLKSKNGTFVNGTRIDRRTEVGDGDEVRLGPLALTVKIVARADETQTASSS